MGLWVRFYVSLCANHWRLMKNIQVVFYRPPTLHKHTDTSKHHQSHTYTCMYTVSAMNALHFSPNHSNIETVAHTHTFTNAQPSPAAISNEILKAFSVFLCHILNSAAVVARHTHTQTLLNYHWGHRLAQMQTHITTQSYTIYSITLILFPSFTHTLADRSCTHTGMRARIFLLPRNQSLTQIQLPVFPWRSQSFSHATPRRRSEGGHFLPKSSSILSLHHGFELVLFISASLSSLFISEEIIRERAKRRKKQLVNYKKRDIGRGRRGERRGSGFFKVCGFWLFSWPIEPRCALSPQTQDFKWMLSDTANRKHENEKAQTDGRERVEKVGGGV